MKIEFLPDILYMMVYSHYGHVRLGASVGSFLLSS